MTASRLAKGLLLYGLFVAGEVAGVCIVRFKLASLGGFLIGGGAGLITAAIAEFLWPTKKENQNG